MAEVVRLLSNANPFLTKKVEAAEVICWDPPKVHDGIVAR